MFERFEFDLPGELTRQVQGRLESMRGMPLTQESLQDLGEFEKRIGLATGVYQLALKREVVFVWKAQEVRDWLEEHYRKLRGRRGIRLADLEFRCLMMDLNWTSIANETSLIAHYRALRQAKWNGTGFGTKDVGRGREDTEPSWFDRHYPINEDYVCDQIPDDVTVGSLAKLLKSQLPFTFRFEIPKDDGVKPVVLRGVPRKARDLIRKLVNVPGGRMASDLLPQPCHPLQATARL